MESVPVAELAQLLLELLGAFRRRSVEPAVRLQPPPQLREQLLRRRALRAEVHELAWIGREVVELARARLAQDHLRARSLQGELRRTLGAVRVVRRGPALGEGRARRPAGALAAHEGPERAPVVELRLRADARAQRLREGRQEVDVRDELVHGAAGDRAVARVQDERHVQLLLVDAPAVPGDAVAREPLAVIGGHDPERAAGEPARLDAAVEALDL